MKHAILTIITALFAADAAFAQAVDIDAVLACRNIVSSDLRLACFDTTTTTRESPGDTVNPVSSAASVDTAGAAQSRERRYEEEFGAEDFRGRSEARRRGDEANAKRPQSIEVAVVEIGRTARGKALIVLANGQVWRQIDSDGVSFRAPNSVNDLAAVISRGALGSYRMKLGKSRTMKVRRLR